MKITNNTTFSGYAIHPIANIVPMAVKLEQEALEYSIKHSGQKEPILLIRNKIVDGRCRAKACEALGIDVLVKHLPHKTTLKELEDLVMATHTRRNRTASQRACTAVRKFMEDETQVQAKLYIKYAIDKKTFSAAKYVYIWDRISFETIEAGGSVTIRTIENSKVTSPSIVRIAKIVKTIKEDREIIIPDPIVDVESELLEAEKQWLAITQGSLNRAGDLNSSYSKYDVDTLLRSLAKQMTAPRNTEDTL